MWRNLCSFAAAALLLALMGSQATWVQKPGGISECPISTTHNVSICTISLIASS